jgi:hypothetical protein
MSLSKATLRRLPVAGLIVLGALVASCERHPTEPRGAADPESLNPSFDLGSPMRPPAPGTLTGTISPTASRVAVGPISLGTFADTTLVSVTTVSNVKRYWSSFPGAAYPGAFLGDVGPGSTYSQSYGCWNHPYYVSAMSTVSHCPASYGTSGDMSKTTTGTMYGTVNARWSPKTFYSVGNCDGNSYTCYTYTGGYSVTIVPTFNTLRLTATSSNVLVGDSVTFVASTSNNGAFTVRNWIWVPDAGGSSTSPCGTAKVCTFAIPESGVMYVRARVGAKTEQQNKAVTATRPDLELSVNQTVFVPGTQAVFTASTNPAVTFSVQSWTWIPDDTATASSSMSCAAEPLCETTITEPGRAMVTAMVRGALDSAMQAVSTAEPELDVQCPATAQRGGEITCTATVIPAVAFTFKKWSSSSVVTIEGAPYSVDSVVNQPVAAGEAIAWGPGEVVLDSTNVAGEASVSVGGREWPSLTDAALVRVTKRPWQIPIDTLSIEATRLAGFDSTTECHTERHNLAPVHGWITVPNRCAETERGSLYPHQGAVPNPAGYALRQVPNGPNAGVWYADSLKTKLWIRMQILRDFRADAVPITTTVGDSVYSGCANNLPLQGFTMDVTIGVADSVCMGGTGFKDRVTALWNHEHCHQTRTVRALQDTHSKAQLDSLEAMSTKVYAEAAMGPWRYLRRVFVHMSDSSQVIDMVPPQSWPTYWGRISPGGVMFDPLAWTRSRPNDSLNAMITCPAPNPPGE